MDYLVLSYSILDGIQELNKQEEVTENMQLHFFHFMK